MDAPYLHRSVLLSEIVAALQPREDGVYCDATLGGGGHTEAILQASAPKGFVFGIDRDAHAVQAANARLQPYKTRFLAVAGSFGEVASLLQQQGVTQLDGLLADLGVSSPQLDNPTRGFSFQKSGPIDMRMDNSQATSALDLLQTWSETELAFVLQEYGEEKFSKRIARAIKQALPTLQDTLSLAKVIANAVPVKEPGKDSATRSFQALRMATNDELRQLDQLLIAANHLVRPGGRLAIISFHSLEDRLVKQHLRGQPNQPSKWRMLTTKPVVATEQETQNNPRSRSAKLRVAERLPERTL